MQASLKETAPLATSAQFDSDAKPAGFEDDLRLSHRLVVGLLIVLSMALAMSGELLDEAAFWRLDLLSLILFSVALLMLLLERISQRAAAWLAVLALIALVLGVERWLAIPGALTLLAVPVGLAATAIGFPAALAVTVGETAALLGGDRFAPGSSPGELAVAVTVLWSSLGALYGVHRPARALAGWAWEHYRHAQGLLDEARDRKVELAQALDDLAHANRQLALAHERTASLRLLAEEAQAAKTRFVSRVSHELRTPLNMITGLVDLMVSSPEIYAVALSPKMREDLQVVQRNCEHLSRMINDVLDLTQMEAGRMPLHRERVDLRQVIEDTLEAVSPLIRQKGLTLDVKMPPRLPRVYCDRTRIQQVVLNLLSNAARYTDSGGITVGVTPQDGRVMISVADTGPGIAPEDTERIFEPFGQGGGDLWRDRGGNGLGLSISKQFVNLHGGQMSVRSELGVGTTFSFDLPISPPMPPTAHPQNQIKEEWEWLERQSRYRLPDAHYNPRVVLYENGTGDLGSRLSRYADQVEVIGVKSVAEVMREVRDCPAQAVLLNVEDSPDEAGTLLERLRPELPDTPIVACSVPGALERAVAAGAAGYLTKPITCAELGQVLRGVGSAVNTVLVVDDDPDALELFERMLRVCDETLRVQTASDARSALRALRGARPDLLLLDVVLPDRSGWAVLEAVAAEPDLHLPPTYLLSAQDPLERPPASDYLLVVAQEGFSVSKLLRSVLTLSRLLLEPDGEPDPGPV